METTKKKCLCNSRITSVQLFVVDFWGLCVSQIIQPSWFQFVCRESVWYKGLHLLGDLVFYCIEGGCKTHTFLSSYMGGFDRCSLHSQQQPISFKGGVLGTRWRWRMKYMNFLFPVNVNQIWWLRFLKQEDMSFVPRGAPSLGCHGPAGKQPFFLGWDLGVAVGSALELQIWLLPPNSGGHKNSINNKK